MIQRKQSAEVRWALDERHGLELRREIRRLSMIKERSIRAPVKPLFAEIIRIARVPDASAQSFCNALNEVSGGVWDSYRYRPLVSWSEERQLRNRALVKLNRFARQASELRENFEKLNEPAKSMFMRGAFTVDHRRRLADGTRSNRAINTKCYFDPFLTKARTLEVITSEVVKEMTLYLKPCHRPRGRPRGKPNGGLYLPRFVLHFLRDVRAAGGRLTLDKNEGTGTLVDALVLLRPYLPPNFIPNKLPLSSLANVKALDKKIGASN
jgi:hypothetical protein